MTEYLLRPGGRLAYDVAGPASAPLVVAVHGMGANRHAFRLLTPVLLERGYRVAALDLRGHGESSPVWPGYNAELIGDDVLALIRELGGPAVLIGSSISAASVTFAAASAPDQVSALVLIGATAQRRTPNVVMGAAQEVVLRSATLWGVYYRTLFKAGRPADFDADTAALLRQLREKGRLEAVRRVLDPTSVWWTERAGAVACPVQVVMGTRDPDFPDPAAEATAAARAFGPAAMAPLLVDGAGHYPFLDAPRVTNDAIAAFLGNAVRA